MHDLHLYSTTIVNRMAHIVIINRVASNLCFISHMMTTRTMQMLLLLICLIIIDKVTLDHHEASVTRVVTLIILKVARNNLISLLERIVRDGLRMLDISTVGILAVIIQVIVVVSTRIQLRVVLRSTLSHTLQTNFTEISSRKKLYQKKYITVLNAAGFFNCFMAVYFYCS